MAAYDERVDELTQLFNVFKGDMSLVGRPDPWKIDRFPRTTTIYYLPWHDRLAQVSGRDDITLTQNASG